MRRPKRHYGSVREAVATIAFYATGVLMAVAIILVAVFRHALDRLSEALIVLAAVLLWGVVSVVAIVVIERDPKGRWQPPESTDPPREDDSSG